MNTSEQKSALNSALTKEVATTTISKADVATTHLFSGEGPKVRACSLMSLSGPVGKRFFEPTVKELCSFERAALAKQTGSRMQSNSLSVKVSNTHMKSRLASSSVKRSRSNEDLKPHVRTIVRGKSSSDLLEKVILKRSQATKFKCYGNVTQDSLDEVNSNTPKCLLKSDLRSSCSPSPKKKKTANKADAELPTELKKKLDSKKRMLPMGKMISVTPSPATSNEVARNENKFFPTAICSSRLPILLDRKSQWEKVAMKSRSMFLKQRSQKMLKERLKKYRLVTPKSNVNNSETLAVEKETPVPYSTTKQTLPKFNQSLFLSDLNNKEVGGSGTSCRNDESETLMGEGTPSKKILSHKDTIKIPLSLATGSLPFTTINESNQKIMSRKGNVNIFSHNDIEDDAEMEVKKEVELLVEKAMREAATNSFRTNRDSKKSVDNSVEKDSDVARDDAKLRKIRALVAEENLLTKNLNDINSKMNKIKAELYALFNESSQVTKRLDEVRLFKNYLLNNSAWKMARQ